MSTPSFLPSLPAFALSVLAALTAMFGTLPTRVHAQALDGYEAAPGPRSQEAVERDFALIEPMQRAERVTRAGATLLAVGGVGTLASAIIWARLDNHDCPTRELFCDNQWTKGMGALSGLTIGSGLMLTGLVTLSVGVARRNRLRRVEGLAVGVGPSRLDLSLRF